MEIYFQLGFLTFFQVLGLVTIRYYYHRVEYAYIRFVSYAMVFQIFAQIFLHIGYTKPDQVLWPLLTFVFEFGLGLMLLVAVIDILERKMPWGFIAVCGAAFVSMLVYVSFLASFPWELKFSAQLPGLALLAMAVIRLVNERREGFGAYLISGFLGLYIALTVATAFFLPSPSLLPLFGFVGGLLLNFSCIAFVAIAMESMLEAIKHKNTDLQRITEENKALELQFSQAQKLESLGGLAAGLAHDFNNMLTSILGYASLVMKKLPADSEIRKDVYMIMSGARQSVELTSQMLTYAGESALEFESVDLSKAVTSMDSLITSVVPKGVKLNMHLAENLPRMKGDRIQLGQVVMNLVINAVESLQDKEGEITVETGLTHVTPEMLANSEGGTDQSAGTYLYLLVRDNGEGISEDALSRIFEPFFSQKTTNKGLGLSSLSGIVRQHRGFSRVESILGVGSAFWTYFPTITSELTQKSEPGPGLAKSRGKILLADDDPRIRSLMTSILESDNFQLITTGDGKEALQIYDAHEGEFDLMVLDCTMPKMSGSEVYREIRDRKDQIPIVLVSGFRQQQTVSEVSEDPLAYFIKKPFDVDQLLELVNEAMQKRRYVRPS